MGMTLCSEKKPPSGQTMQIEVDDSQYRRLTHTESFTKPPTQEPYVPPIVKAAPQANEISSALDLTSISRHLSSVPNENPVSPREFRVPSAREESRLSRLDSDMSIFEKKDQPTDNDSYLDSIKMKYQIPRKKPTFYDNAARPKHTDNNQSIHCTDGTIFLKDGTLLGPDNIYFKPYTSKDQKGDLHTKFTEILRSTDNMPSLLMIVNDVNKDHK